MFDKNQTVTTSHASKKKQNYNKSGKAAARKEQRRQEAIARQIRRLTNLQSVLDKSQDSQDDVEGKYFRAAGVNQAKRTLKEIQGKQSIVVKRY